MQDAGYNLSSSKTELAQMEGTSTIDITGAPTINGSVFGAGKGITNYSEMAKLIGTSNVSVNTSTSFEIYGGGNISRIEGTSNVNINSGNHTASIYGGGNVGEIEGNTIVNINGGTTNTVYGGGNQAKVTTSTVNIKGGVTTDVFAGGNSADV